MSSSIQTSGFIQIGFGSHVRVLRQVVFSRGRKLQYRAAEVRRMRWKHRKNYYILKATSYKTPTNIRVAVITYKKSILTIGFRSSDKFKNGFEQL